MCASCSSKGNTAGIISADANDEIRVKVVIVLMFPPSLPVTTGAADADGPMTQVSTPSHRIFCSILSPTKKMMPTLAATSTICATSTHKCQRWGRIWWKSTLQKVTSNVRNTKNGNMTSNTGPNQLPAASSAGT